MNIEKFLEIITRVAHTQRLHLPEFAYWNCRDFSEAVHQLAQELGFAAELVSTQVKFKEKLGEIERGEWVDHTLVRIAGIYYDWTARQFNPRARFPRIMNSLPADYNSPKTVAPLHDEGVEFWLHLLHKQLPKGVLAAAVPKLQLTDEDLDKMGIIEIGNQLLTLDEFYRLPQLVIPRDLDLRGSGARKLPTNLHVLGNLDITGTGISELPRRLTVGGNLYLYRTRIRKLPEDLKVGGRIWCREGQFQELPAKFQEALQIV